MTRHLAASRWQTVSRCVRILSMNMVGIQSFKGREKARRYAMQALYGWVIANHDVKDIEKFYRADRNPKNYDVEYFVQLLHAIPNNAQSLDAQLEPFLDRPLHSIDPIELTILRIAAYELTHCYETPFKVIIHEAVELAQMFGAQDSYKFINSILDNMSKKIRASETDDTLMIISSAVGACV